MLTKILVGICVISTVWGQSCVDDYIIGKTSNVLFRNCDTPAAGDEWPIKVEKVTLGNALFHLKQKKSWFFVGEPVQICIEGKFTVDLENGLPNPLQNVVHGDVALIGELGVKAPFCDIPKDSCSGMKTQSCNDGTPISAGDSFCFCSGIGEVPVSPDVDAEVYWKILKIPGSSPPTTCEIEWNVNNLKNIQNKSTLMCIQLPTKVKNQKPRVFQSEKSEIQDLLNG
jgi:hypothetical protein